MRVEDNSRVPVPLPAKSNIISLQYQHIIAVRFGAQVPGTYVDVKILAPVGHDQGKA
jgi:hypothetical protein